MSNCCTCYVTASSDVSRSVYAAPTMYTYLPEIGHMTYVWP